MDPVYIVGATRTPIGRFGGTLAKFSAVELGVTAAQAAIARAGVDPRWIVETVIGHARQAGCGPNPARQMAIRAGLPDTAPAATINQACASGLRAIALAHDAIRLGRADIILAGGTESMSNTPYLLTRARFGYRLGHGELLDGNYQDGFFCPLADQLMGRTAETLAQRYAISRDEQDEYALRSQQRAAAARAHWQTEIAPVMVADRKLGMIPFSTDEHVRGETTLDDLRQLAPVFKDHGSVTAGNSSAITDAAAAMLVASGEAVKQHGLTPQARIVDYTVAGVDPKVMGLGPVPAIRQLLERTHIPLAKVDLIELNEAFAAQVIACDRELHLDMERTNVNGGAIALGHPIGCSGARIVVTLVHEMNRRQSRYGLAALCVSGGMGMAMLLEKP
jgi:acetyl-CoA C-acetyltransferase